MRATTMVSFALSVVLCLAVVHGEEAVVKAEASGVDAVAPSHHKHGLEGHYKVDGNYKKKESDYCPQCPTAETTCACGCPLPFNREDGFNGCTSSACTLSNNGALCVNTTTNTAGTCFSCVNAMSDGWAYCRGTPEPNVARTGGGALCFTVQCQTDGTIRITGSAVSLACATGSVTCGISDFLYVYKGAYNTGTLLADNQLNVDITDTCTAGEFYSVCEKDGIIITNTLSASFTSLYSTECPNTCVDYGCTTCGL